MNRNFLGAMVMFLLIAWGCGRAGTIKDLPSAISLLQYEGAKERRRGDVPGVGYATPKRGDEDLTESEKWTMSCKEAEGQARSNVAREVVGQWEKSEEFGGLTSAEQLRRKTCAENYVRNLSIVRTLPVVADHSCAARVAMAKDKRDELEKFLKTGKGAGYSHTTNCPSIAPHASP